MIPLYNNTNNTLVINGKYKNPNKQFAVDEKTYLSDEVQYYLNEGMIYRIDSPSVMIAMPVKDGAEYLLQCLTTLSQMKYPHDKMRFVFAYGKSKDNTLQIINEFFKNKDFKYEIHEDPPYKNPTNNALYTAESMNILSAHLKDEEYALVIDDDIISIPPNTLDDLIKLNLDVVAPVPMEKRGNRYLFFDTYGFRINSETTEYLKHEPDHPFFHSTQYVEMTSVGTMVLVKRAVIKRVPWKNPFPRLRFCQDARRLGYKVWAIPWLTVIHANVLHEPHHQTLEHYAQQGIVPKSDVEEMLKGGRELPITVPVTIETTSAIPTDCRKVLIKRIGGIGDILMITSVLARMKKRNPNLIIDFETQYPELLDGNPNVSSAFKSGTRTEQDAETVNLDGVVETPTVGGGTISDKISETTNRIDLFFKHFNIPTPKSPKIKYFLKDNEIKKAKLLLKENGICEDDIVIGYAGIPVTHRRGYPLELVRQLFDLLLVNPKIKIVLFGTGRRSLTESDQTVLNSLPPKRILDLIDKTAVREVASLMNCCDLIVACDSGLLHMANAVGTPNIALFGTIDPMLRTKHYPLCRVIFPKGRLPCIPCNDRGVKCKKWSRIEKFHTIGGECMWQITPEEIRDAVLEHIKTPKETTISISKLPPPTRIIKIEGDIDKTISRLDLPRNEWKVFFPVSSIEANHYAGGLVYIWQVVHALLANDINVVVATENEPLFDRDFKNYPNRDKLHIIVDKNGGRGITEKSFCFDFVMGIQPCGGVAVDIAERFNVPSYLWLFDPPNYAKRYKKLKNTIHAKWRNYKHALERADYVIIMTEVVRKWVEEWLDINPRKIIQLYPCINSIEANKANTGNIENEITFLGRIIPDKHPELLFETLKDIKNPPSINFIGPVDTESDLTKRFKDLSKKTNIPYRIYEKIPDKKKFEILNRSKLLVYPSTYEAFGLPPLEAGYMGTSSVVYDLPSYKEWDNDTFYKIPFGNSVALSKKVKEILCGEHKQRDCAELKKFGSFGRLVGDVKKIIPPFRPSVIMTVYNGAEYVKYALASIYDWAWEIIIVEGVVENMYKFTNSLVSTDGTSEIINQFIKEHDKEGKIKYKRFYRPLKNKIELQSEAVKEITGNILFKLDSDEIYKKEHLQLLKDAYISDPNLDLVYFTTLNFWTSFKLITHGLNWDVQHFKICRYRKGMKYVDGHSQMKDTKGNNVVWQNPDYKTIFMPEVVNYHFGWCQRSVANKLSFIKNRQFDYIDEGIHDTYSSWTHGKWSDPYMKAEGIVSPFLGELPETLENHPYKNVGDVRLLK